MERLRAAGIGGGLGGRPDPPEADPGLPVIPMSGNSGNGGDKSSGIAPSCSKPFALAAPVQGDGRGDRRGYPKG